MADLGFLPCVRRIMERTPRVGQRMLFSATLDAGVNVIVKRFLTNPVTHSADTNQSPISTMAHHIFHVKSDARLPVLLDLTSAPGRTMVFTRTKHGAKKPSKQLNASGVPTVELHGNLSQNARTRNMEAFQTGAANTLVATDIAARGIHVDDVALVIHADPPVEHKAYLHRSGRTARAGAEGTVITLMTDDQVADVRDLTRKAGIKATTTRVDADHPLLRQLAPGERTFTSPLVLATDADNAPRRNGGGRGSRTGGARSSGARATGGRGGSPRGGAGRSTAAGAGSSRGGGGPVAQPNAPPAPPAPSARLHTVAPVPAARVVRPRSTRRPRRAGALPRSPRAPASGAAGHLRAASPWGCPGDGASCSAATAEQLCHLGRVDVHQ